MCAKPFTAVVTGAAWQRTIGGGRSTQEEKAREFFDTLEEAQAYAAQQAPVDWDPTRKAEVRGSNEEDIARQHLDDLAEELQALVDKAMRERPLHPLSAGLIADTLKEAVDETVYPYFEDNDPRSMGWVGSDGLP